MANQSLAILCFFSFILLFFTFVSADQCHPDDKEALLQIKEHFRNSNTLKTWTPNTDCCYWFQVDCDQTTYRVTFVKTLYNSNTIGPIPSVIGDLPYLQVLGMSNLLNVTGPIRQPITKLKNLIFLDLSSINIGGKIPEFLFELTSLTHLILSDSKFCSPLPTSMGKLTNLQTLLLDRNGFTGTIPTSFTKITKLIVFSVSNNKLCGQIPFGGKLQAFDNSSYYNKKFLCGAPLPAC